MFLLQGAIPGFPGGLVSSFLTFVMLTLVFVFPRSNIAIAPSRENASLLIYASFASIGTNLGFVFLQKQ